MLPAIQPLTSDQIEGKLSFLAPRRDCVAIVISSRRREILSSLVAENARSLPRGRDDKSERREFSHTLALKMTTMNGFLDYAVSTRRRTEERA
jgi:hypothetical protein